MNSRDGPGRARSEFSCSVGEPVAERHVPALGPFAVAERLDDLAVADAHEVHAAEGCLGGVEPPTDDGAIAVYVDVLDFETDVWLTDEPLPPDEALVVASPTIAVGRGAHALHDAVVGDDADELFGRPQPEASLNCSITVLVSVMVAAPFSLVWSSFG
jgi:hypothetical protein